MKDITDEDLKTNLLLVSRTDYRRDVRAGNVLIGPGRMVIMAGPCTVESRTQVFEIARIVSECGADMLRGGVFKPLTFPYGDPLGQPDADAGVPAEDRKRILRKTEQFNAAEKRLAYLKEAGEKYGLPVISEILYAGAVGFMAPYVDMFQIGHRHMFNMDLIETLADTEKPVMIKRHAGESLRSLLGVAEHFEARGKHDFVFCERGAAAPHTHNPNSRAVLDIQAIPALKEYAPSVPVIVDPSHAASRSAWVPPMARAAIAAGADGLLIEVHPDPEKAWVDAFNAVSPSDFAKLMDDLHRIREIVA